MTKQRVSYTLDSTLETVDNAEQTATRIAAEAGFEEDEVMRISMAVREAAINAVLHGNAYDPGFTSLLFTLEKVPGIFDEESVIDDDVRAFHVG